MAKTTPKNTNEKLTLNVLEGQPGWTAKVISSLEPALSVQSIASVETMKADGLIIDSQTARQLSELRSLGGSLGEILEKLRADIAVMEKIHRLKLPKRFPKVKGLNVVSRYLVGEAPGGDHFDMAESKASSRVSLLMTDASSYGLAGAILDVIMRVAMKLSVDELKHADQFVKQIYEEVMMTLGKKDKLSVFYGLLSRSTHTFEYVSLGTNRVFFDENGKGFKALPVGEAAIPLTDVSAIKPTGQVQLSPQDRLLIVSDGFVEALGGVDSFEKSLRQIPRESADKCLTELVYRLKKTLPSDDDIPKQDCSVMCVELDSNVLKLA